MPPGTADADGAGAAAVPPPADCPTGFPHAAQLFAPAVSCAPQFAQNAISPSSSVSVATRAGRDLARGHYHQTTCQAMTCKNSQIFLRPGFLLQSSQIP